MRGVGCLLLAGLFSCGGATDEGLERHAENLLLVTFDTTRADRIGCYGHEAASTPTLDRLAEDGVLFERCITPAPITLPSHSTLLTVAPLPFQHTGAKDFFWPAFGFRANFLEQLVQRFTRPKSPVKLRSLAPRNA